MADIVNNSVSLLQIARREKVVRSIEENAWQLQAAPADKIHVRDAPKIDGACLKLHYNRQALAKAVREHPALKSIGQSLVNDRSAPYIEEGIVIRFSERRAFLFSLILGAERFYGKVLSAVSSFGHSSVEAARYFAHNAPAKASELADDSKEFASTSALKTKKAFSTLYSTSSEKAQQAKLNAQGLLSSSKQKAGEIVDLSKEKAGDFVDFSKETAVNAKVKAQTLIGNGKDKAEELIEFSKEKSGEFVDFSKETASDLVQSAKTTVYTAQVKSSALASVVAEKTNEMYCESKQILTRKSSKTVQFQEQLALSQVLRDVQANTQSLNHVQESQIHDCSIPKIDANAVNAMGTAINAAI